MKDIVLLFFLSIVLTINGNGQTASATWPLTSNTVAVVIGNVTAPGQVLSKTAIATDTLAVSEFLNGIDKSGSPVAAELLWLNGTGWPQDTSQNIGRYIEFSVSPLKGYNLTINSIAMKIGCVGSNGHFFVNIYYSTDSSFSTSTKLTPTPLVLPDLRTMTLVDLLYTPTIAVDHGKKFLMRIFPWYNSTSKNPATKYICLSNVVISGSTAAQIPIMKTK